MNKLGCLFLLFFFACGTNENSSIGSIDKNTTKQTISKDTIHLTRDAIQVKDTTNQIPDWIFEKVANQKLDFKNNKALETHLYELNYIGQIPIANKAPFLIFSGRDCDGCDENISIYIHSPSDGEINVAGGQHRYQYPGKERDYETNSLTYQSKAFYGQILDTVKGVVWYQKVLLENNSWESNLFIANVNSGKIKEATIKDKGQHSQTIALLKQGKCKEIKGKEFSSEP